MNQINSIVSLDLCRLDKPLPAMKAKVAHNFIMSIIGVPDDCDTVFVRVFRANGAYADVSAERIDEEIYKARIPATCFPAEGEFVYEIHATALDDEKCAFGRGRCDVGAFSVTTTPTKGESVTVTEMPCEGGGYVQVKMVWDGFDWVQNATVITA